MTKRQRFKDMTEEEKEIYNSLLSANEKDYPNIKDMD